MDLIYYNLSIKRRVFWCKFIAEMSLSSITKLCAICSELFFGDLPAMTFQYLSHDVQKFSQNWFCEGKFNNEIFRDFEFLSNGLRLKILSRIQTPQRFQMNIKLSMSGFFFSVAHSLVVFNPLYFVIVV